MTRPPRAIAGEPIELLPGQGPFSKVVSRTCDRGSSLPGSDVGLVGVCWNGSPYVGEY